MACTGQTVHNNKLNVRIIPSSHASQKIERFFFFHFMFTTNTLGRSVGGTQHAESPTACAYESLSSRCIDPGLCSFAYNCAKHCNHRGLWSTCKHLLCDLKMLHNNMPHRRDERRREMKRKKWKRKNKGPLAFYCCANESHFVFCVSAQLLSLSSSVWVCVCVLPSFSLCFHFSSTGISLPNGK